MKSVKALARRYVAFVLMPSLVTGLFAMVFLGVAGATPGYAFLALVRTVIGVAFFCLAVAWPAAEIARWRGSVSGPGGMSAGGAVLGALCAVLAANYWIAYSGSPAMTRPSLGTVWFSVLAFGFPLGAVSGLLAWGMVGKREIA